MKVKFISIMLLTIFLLSNSGCSGAWRKKFVRAKKGEVKEGPILQPYDYAREFTNKQLYANNYTFWRNSESELINSIKSKDNIKRIRNQAGYAIVDIKKLSSLLVDEKRAEIEPYIFELEDMIEKIDQPNYVSSNSNVLVSRLSRHYRTVSRNFSYQHMKNFIKPDNVKEEADDAQKQ
jgi:hypothetical protein